MAHFNFVISQNDVVTYCTEASNQKSKHVYRKILFYKKSTGLRNIMVLLSTLLFYECISSVQNNLSLAVDVM